MGTLDGQVAIITGGSRGIGFAVARRLAQSGASIAIVSTKQEHSDAAVAQLQQEGFSNVKGYACDVAKAEDVDAALQAILADFGGKVDILVSNAGITRDTLLMRMSEEDWDRVQSVNLKGAFLWCKALIRPMMKARSGRIILMASVVGLIGNAGQVNYAAAKAGLIGMGKSIAKEVGSRNITVNMIAPGFVETEMTASLPEAIKEQFIKSIPLGRAAKPEDVANAVNFLVGPEAAYISGQVLAVDGGMTMCG